MNKKGVWFGALTLVVLGLLFWWLRPRSPAGPVADSPLSATNLGSIEQELLPRQLYFPGAGGKLYSEERELSAAGTLVERIEHLVKTLLAGPNGTSLRAPFSDGFQLQDVYLLENETIALNFVTAEGESVPTAGSQREMLTIYSLVNTVLLNFEEVSRVLLLWDGRQRDTFAGHLSIDRPLKLNRDLIAAADPAVAEE